MTGTVVTEEQFMAAVAHLKECTARNYPCSPIVLHPKDFAEWQRRGWIDAEGRIEWRKIREAVANG